MARPSKTDQELGAFRDCWNELRTLEADHQGFVSIIVNPLARPGMFSVRMTFTSFVGNIEEGQGAHGLAFMYPNVENSTFAGFMWRKAIALRRMVDEGSNRPVRPYKKEG
jgi:hypothetical protein